MTTHPHDHHPPGNLASEPFDAAQDRRSGKAFGLRKLVPLLKPAVGSRPLTSGSLRLRGLRAPLTIRRDKCHVAYVDAENDDDAWLGLGFCQAQDRAFQLELRLRTVRGTLSELVGAPTVDIDRLSRRIGFIEASRRQLAVLDADVRAQIEAFVRGVNAGLAAGSERRAIEFLLLGAHPTPWQATDVVAMGKLMSFLMIGNWDVELARLKILLSDGPQALRDLDPAYAGDISDVMSRTALPLSAVDRLSEDMSRLVEFAGRAGASNAWALDGTRTKSGRPVFASDPHLEPTLPPHWYLAHLRTPEWSVAGASLVGTPAIGAGHNGFAAWGLTAGLADQVDLFIEEVGPDGASVRRGDGYEPCTLRREVINVRRAPSLVEEVLETPRGPVIGPALQGEVGAISLRAVWLDARPARGLSTAHRVTSFESMRAELSAWPLFSQNVVYADATGQIGWQLAGEIPRRRQGWGTLPQPASYPDTGWEDERVTFASMPFLAGHRSGFIVSANQAPPVEGAGKPYLGIDWLDSYRASRIVEALGEGRDWDRDAVMRLQMDEKTLTWREVRDAILACRPATTAGHRELEALRAWDGVLAAGSSAATVFELLFAEIWRRVAEARAPRSASWALGKGFSSLLPLTTFSGGRPSRMLRHIREQPEGWFARSWPDEIGDALDAVVLELERRFGPDTAGWAWGTVRPLTLEHPMGRVKALAPLFNRGPFAWGGDGNTISQAAMTPLFPLANPSVAASLRFAVEVGDWDGARFSLPGGQSGDPLSPHYDDLLPFWLRGDGVSIAWSLEAVAKAAVSTLQLSPL